jgi:long-chain acyl-CoA synthetase
VVAQDSIKTLGDILPVNARTYGRKVAVQEWDGTALRDTTYRELQAQVDGFSEMLRSHGIVPRERVAILMPNGRPWVVAYFGIVGVGAVAVPLEYESLDAAPEHVRFALGHAEARAVVVAPKDAPRVRPVAAGTSADVLPFSDEVPPRPSPAGEARSGVCPSDLAQILYTSGTTGRKKGVMLTHASILSNVRACVARFGVRDDDCLPALLPHHPAYPLTTTVVVPLYAGARMPIGDIRDRSVGEFLRASRPTVLVGVPRLFEALLSALDGAARREGALGRLRRAEALSGAVKRWAGVNIGRALFRGLHRRLFGGAQLRLCISGGARLKRETALRYFRLGIPLMQGWGMTELSPVGAVQPCSWVRFHFTRYYERQAGSIGPPLDGTGIRLIDVPEQDVCVDRDGRGEMVAWGPHVMAGYYRDPETTSRMLCEDGLRTGDMARRDAEGNYFIVGRAKHVIVLPGGKKVFPEEDLCEDLARCPLIEEFAVRAITDRHGTETIGIILKPNAEALRGRGPATVGELFALLKREMDNALKDKPDYMRRFDFCLTELRDGRFSELVKTGMKEPCPLKNQFRVETAYSTCCDSHERLDLVLPDT